MIEKTPTGRLLGLCRPLECKPILPLLILLCVLILTGCKGEDKPEPAGKPPPAPSAAKATDVTVARGEIEPGRIVYDTYCHFCHGRKGMGDGPVGIAVTPHPADFVGDKKRMAKSDAKLMKSINEGIVKAIGGEEMAMPSWKKILTEKERRDVLAYIRHLSRQGNEPAAKKEEAR